MDVHRIDGIKYDFDALSIDELEGIHGHLLEQHARVTGYIALVEEGLFSKRHPKLELGAVGLNGAALDPRIEAYGEIADGVAWQKFMDATRDVRG